MNAFALVCSVLLLAAIEARFSFTEAPRNHANGTGFSTAPNGTVYSTLPPLTNSTGNGTTPCVNGAVVFSNGTHFLVSASGNSSLCPPYGNFSTTPSPFNVTYPTPTPSGNYSDPANSTYAPFTNGTFGIYGNGTHFWVVDVQSRANHSERTRAPINGTQFTLAPVNTSSPFNNGSDVTPTPYYNGTYTVGTNYTISSNGTFVTPTPSSNGTYPIGTNSTDSPSVTSAPGSNGTYTVNPTGTTPPGNYSELYKVLFNAKEQKQQQPVVINIVVGGQKD